MKAIVCVDNNWAIGKNNDLLVRIPEDMKRFRAFTTGNVIVMGRRTLESFPNGMPLPNRVNIVLTHNQNFSKKDVIVAHSLEELDEVLETFDDQEIYLVGGDSLYKQLVPMCDEVIVTKVDFEYDADRFFPNLDEDEDWYVESVSDEQIYYDIIYHYITYRRKK